MYNDERLIEAEREFLKALDSGDEEAMIYWFGYRNGVKWAIEKEMRKHDLHGKVESPQERHEAGSGRR